MANIYRVPDGIKVPELNYENFPQYEKDCDLFLRQLKVVLRNKSKGKNVGEIIQFPVGDGYAEYMVASMRPLELVHIPLGDSWNFQYVHLLTAKEVQQKIDQQNAMKQLFGPKK